ncbi:FAD-binding protein [Campylobacter jejuni]|uniref:FAD-binding protein n=1 Tax=Campylobacter jejuni TaxID=197 RepID=UPI003A884177
MDEFSRRDFIKTTCISVGALAASSSGVYALDDSSKMDKDTNLLSCDVLVIGSGGAGLRAAVAVRKENPKLSVVVATKMMPSRNATCMAEGGINGVTDFSNGDSYKLHAYDTIKGGAYLVDQDAALKFCELAGKAILI